MSTGKLVVIIISVVLGLGLFLFYRSTVSKSPAQSTSSIAAFQVSPKLKFRRDHRVVRVPHKEDLDPLPGDFSTWALLVSTKFKKLPADDTRQVIAVKYNSDLKPYTGWALSVAKRHGICCYPELYWSSAEHGGQWYRFPRIEMEANAWLVFGMSYEEARYLVLRTLSLKSGEEAKHSSILGAYDLGLDSRAFSESDLILGAPTGSGFRGSFDFAGIFRGSVGKDQKWFMPTLASVLSRRDEKKDPGRKGKRDVILDEVFITDEVMKNRGGLK